MDKEQAIEKIREFNRFYTSILSLLDKSYLDSGYSVTEARILYEVRECKGCTANLLAQALRIDKGYLSRILHRLADEGLLEREPSREDTRKYILSLTPRGSDETQRLIALSNAQISGIIQKLSGKDCEALCQSIGRITEILGKECPEWKS